MSITEQHTEESLCFAHIYALAGMAGINYSAKKTYDYGVDGQFSAVVNRGNRRIDTGFPLDFQAKATVNWTLQKGQISYDLEAKTYNNFVQRTEAETTMILILLCLPKNREDWHDTSNQETVLRHCCYWHKIVGHETKNNQSRRIHVPSEQLLTPAVLNRLLSLERQRREEHLL